MKSNDFYDDMSIDEILNDVKRLNNEKEPTGKIWSMDEIDALISDELENVAEKQKTEAENIDDILKQLGIEGLEEDGFSINEADDILDEPEEEETGFIVNSFDFQEDIEPLIEAADEVSEISEKIVDEASEEELPGQITIEKTRIFNEVETRAIHKDSINHNIGKSKTIKTGEIPKHETEKDPYRDRFFNQPKLKIENTQDHIGEKEKNVNRTIEKYGVVVKKSDRDKTGADGLSPIPILVDAADEFEAQQRIEAEIVSGSAKSSDIVEKELDNQIVLDGFEEDNDIKIVSEAEEEEKLRKTRRERASKFKLFPNLDYDINEDGLLKENTADNEPAEQEGLTRKISLSDTDAADNLTDEDKAQQELYEEADNSDYEVDEPEEEVRVERDFYGPKDAKAVNDIYKKEISQARFKLVSSIVGLLLLLVCSVITSIFSNFTLFANSPYVYSALNLIVLLAIGVINFKSVLQTTAKLKKKEIDSSTALSISLAVGILQCLVSFAYGDLVLNGMHIYSAVALFPVMLLNLGEYIKLSNDFENFVLLNRESGNFYAVKKIDEEDTAFEVGRGLMIKEPDIRYKAKIGFPDRFVEMTKRNDPTADLFKLVVPVALAAAAVVGIVSSIIYRNVFVAISALTGVYVMAVPAGAVVSMFFNLKEANKQLNVNKGMISGYEAVDDAQNANAVIVDSADIFDKEKTNIYGIKLFNSMRIDEAILYTAAVVIQSGGALSKVFDSIILENRDMLPEVDSLAYEEKLGCSGWIYNYRVLVGNRDLLIKHNVDVQSKENEKKFTSGGKHVIYLAVEGKVAAMFVVGYGADESVAHYFRALERSGINILVKTSDANISEGLVEQYFKLPHNFIKTISPVAGAMFKQYSQIEFEKEPCRILNDGNAKTALKAFNAALILNEQKKISSILQYVGVGIGILLMAMLAFVSGLTQAGVLQMILFESLWSIIVVFVPQLVKKF